MSDIHALSGAYAVDALDDLERAQFERHLRDCESCSRELRVKASAAGSEGFPITPFAPRASMLLISEGSVLAVWKITGISTVDSWERRV